MSNPIIEDYDSKSLERRRDTLRSTRSKRVEKEENMETECDPGYTFSRLDKDREAVSRLPLKGVRKQLDAGPSTGGTIIMSPCDMAEYKRITAMIGELVNLRARIDENYSTRGRDTKKPGLISPLERLRPRVPPDSAVTETARRKKRRRKAGEAGLEDLVLRRILHAIRNRWDACIETLIRIMCPINQSRVVDMGSSNFPRNRSRGILGPRL